MRLCLMWPRVPPKATFCLRKTNNKTRGEESKPSKLREKFLIQEATMPQIPNSSTDDYGADDEFKVYKQEDDANSESGAAVDLVNDLKSDLIKKEAENSEENKSTSNASSAPFAQLINFTQTHLPPLSSRQGYAGRTQSPDEIKRTIHRVPSTDVFHSPHHPYHTTAAQYQYAMYHQAIKAERAGYYESPLWQPHGPVSSQYPPHFSTTATASSAGIPRLSHPSMDPRNALHLSPAPPPNTTVINRPPHLAAAGILSPSSGPLSVVGGENSVSGRDGSLKPKLSHVKKPLNAFMLYMKDMRSKVVSECTLKESAAINQILGKRWHALDRAEQAKYYEMARKERALHMQLYPGWSARDNYAQQGKKKKRKRDKSQEITNPKKCRARYGLDRQQEWCKPCRRKKKCIRFVAGNNAQQDVSGSNASGSTDTENVDTNTSNGTGHGSNDGNCSSESET